ncbi:adenylate/guanylate cyclase domain-containing protein [Acidovorax sp.]|uniref:adenylate/guanylate cyclase domain-containing protein n=1 Tax=Acidovorax sp. TaxID=1872122 RepID=UPI0031E0EECC
MALKDDLISEVRETFRTMWVEQTTAAVPDPQDLRLGNHAKNLEKATVLYADLAGSTNMVDERTWQLSAEVYKTYLRCAARIIAHEGGVVTAYDGDRVMAVFTGDTKNTSAVKAAMKIHHAVNTIINPELKAIYTSTDLTVKHVVGIDTSQLRAARIGVRGYNDLVWIGRAANYAAKLTNLSEKPLWITKAVYDVIADEVKIHNATKVDMWSKRLWTSMNKMEIYCSETGFVI